MAAAVRSPRGLVAAAALVVGQRNAVARLCRGGNIDVVHAHWWVPAGVSAWLARRPYVVTLHGTDVALLARSRGARVVAARVLRGAAAVTAVSSYLAGLAARAAGLKPERIVVQPMPVDTHAFTRTSNGGGGVVTVGRLSKQKRIDLLLDAMAELKRRGGALPLTVVGGGEGGHGVGRRGAGLRIAAQTRLIRARPPPAPRAREAAP